MRLCEFVESGIKVSHGLLRDPVELVIQTNGWVKLSAKKESKQKKRMLKRMENGDTDTQISKT